MSPHPIWQTSEQFYLDNHKYNDLISGNYTPDTYITELSLHYINPINSIHKKQ